MIRFDTFYDLVKAQAAPEGIGENVVATFRTAVQNGLIAVQTDVPCYRDFHVDFVTKSFVRDFCNTDIFTGPRGTIVSVYAFKPGKDCTKYFYTQKSTSHIQCWIDQQRCTTALCAPSNSNAIYDSPYCNYPIGGTDGCLPPYLPAGTTEDDTAFISDCRERIFAVGPNYQVFLAPRFPCGYVVAIQWEGIKRTWADADPVFGDEDLKMAVAKFAEAQLAAKDRQWADVGGLKSDFIDLTRQMAQRCRRERRTAPPRDCSPQIDHILPFVNPTPDSVSLAVYPDGTPGADSAPLAPSPNLVALNTGHLLWVDAIYGNDGLALREREDRPFLTITAAKNAALSGDTIIVRPGSYNENNLMKAGVNYHFIDGAILTYNVPSDTSAAYHGFFDDRIAGAAGSVSVTGSVQMVYRNSNPYNVNCHGAMVIQNIATTFNFEGKKVTVATPQLLQAFAGFYIQNCARCYIDLDELTDTFELWPNLDPDDPQNLPGAAMGIYWELGDTHINIRRNTMPYMYCLWCFCPISGSTGQLWYTGQLMSSVGTGTAASTFYLSAPLASTNPNYRVWIDCDEILSDTECIDALSAGGAKIYINAEKLSTTANNVATVLSSGPELWITTQKISANAQWVSHSGAKNLHLTCQHFEDLSAVADGIFTNCDGVVFIHGGYLKSGAAGLRLVTHAGTGHTKLIGCTLDATANNIATNRPITVSSDGLQIQNCVILAGSNADSSIFANAAKNVRMHAYSVATKAAHANITLNPNATYLIVDANAGL